MQLKDKNTTGDESAYYYNTQSVSDKQPDTYLGAYGSECESITNIDTSAEQTSCTEQECINRKALVKSPSVEEEVIATNTEKEKKKEMAVLTEERLQQMLNNLKEEMTTANENSMKKIMEEGVKTIKEDLSALTSFKVKIESEVEGLQTDTSTLKKDVVDLKAEIVKLKSQLSLNTVQIREISGTNLRQEQRIDECVVKCDEVKERLEANLLRIKGIIEQKGENCVQKVKYFFKNTLEITEEIAIKKAHRLGK